MLHSCPVATPHTATLPLYSATAFQNVLYDQCNDFSTALINIVGPLHFRYNPSLLTANTPLPALYSTALLHSGKF